jgi:hypothetical protein
MFSFIFHLEDLAEFGWNLSAAILYLAHGYDFGHESKNYASVESSFC